MIALTKRNYQVYKSCIDRSALYITFGKHRSYTIELFDLPNKHNQKFVFGKNSFEKL